MSTKTAALVGEAFAGAAGEASRAGGATRTNSAPQAGHVTQANHTTREAGPGFGTLLILTGFALGSAVIAGKSVPGPKTKPSRRLQVKPSPLSRKVRKGALILGVSALADSAVEHYRGDFHHKPMYAGPLGGALLIASAVAEPGGKNERAGTSAARLTSALIGVAGLGFHLRNVTKRPGGINWNNVFYGAPLGAPGALVVGGLLALASQPVAEAEEQKAGWFKPKTSRRRDIARALKVFTGFSLIATSAEAGLLHFRGAFQNPAMFLPVTIPPATGLALFLSAITPARFSNGLARALVRLTQGLGVAGTAFHALGVARNMGGWHNWRQNLQAGPPMPAPISFSGIALAAEAALDLDEDRASENVKPTRE